MKTNRIVLAVMLLSLLPSVAVAGVAGLWLAQAVPTPLDVADKMADKSMSYWFICLAVVAITSWSLIARWLISQLEGQRKTNAELVERLVKYMGDDHGRMIVVVEGVTRTMDRLVDKLEVKGSGIPTGA